MRSGVAVAEKAKRLPRHTSGFFNLWRGLHGVCVSSNGGRRYVVSVIHSKSTGSQCCRPSIFYQAECCLPMFAGRNRVFSDIHRQCTARLGLVQRRWAQVEDVRFLVTHQRTDKIAEKYRDKLQRKAREYDFTSTLASSPILTALKGRPAIHR